MKKKYKISTIIPVYNVEQYLDECINSVIQQTIGFEDNIQIILVNDSSPDNSEEICLKYKNMYPDNIFYVKQKNQGVSVARNNGFKYASGKYVNFLDSDDKLDYDCYEKAYSFLEDNDSIDLVAFRIKYFEKRNDYHALDYKFDGDKIIDINENPDYILLHVNSCVIRKEALKNKKFDKRLRICEDTKLVYQIVLEKCRYGIISSSNYNYRKRDNETSAIQNSKTKIYWYTDTLEYAHNYLVDLSIKKYGKVVPFVQYFIMYELQWRIKSEIKVKLTDEQKKNYKNELIYLLSYIDDDVIVQQKNINLNYKMLTFKLKYNSLKKKLFTIKDECIYINDVLLCNIKDLKNNIELFEYNGEDLFIVGNVNYLYDFDLYYELDGKKKKIKLFNRGSTKNESLGLFNVRNGYKLKIKMENTGILEFYIKLDDNYYLISNSGIHFSRLNSTNKKYYEKKFLFELPKGGDYIKITSNPSILKIILKELVYLFKLVCKHTKIAIIRILYWLSFIIIHKDIYLFADREYMAGDSAEILFKYFSENCHDKNIKSYFVLEKESVDFERMKKYGKVVPYHSLWYKILFLRAKFLISSHADGYVNNEFGKSRKYYVDLYRFKYIYLTHGILLHDSSSWLNRINKNFALNVTTSPLEYKYLCSDIYFFDKEEIIKTGIPRYDNLINLDVKEENKILFMPSWRSSLVGKANGTQHRVYNSDFKNSEYFLFYEKLFSDERLLSVLRSKNIKVKFCIHPSFREQLKDFIPNDCVEYAIDVNSQYETLSSKLLVTDYSSAACDFAYLNKPVIYANFDYDHIYEVHYYNKGYFDYDRDGFGPNCTNYEQFLKELLKSIDNNFKVEKKYLSRMNKFFFYKDNKNAERVYKEIMKYNDKIK